MEDFKITVLENENNERVQYYKSIIKTDKGEQIPIVVDIKIKLPEILQKGHKISIRGSDLEFDGGKGKTIQYKNEIYYEGDSTEQKNNSEVIKKVTFSPEVDRTREYVENLQISSNTSMSSNGQSSSNMYPSRTLLVTNLHPAVTESELMQLFSTIGPVTAVRILRNHLLIYSNCAEVLYRSYNDAVEALRRINNQYIRNQRINVSWSTT